jgi:hypothetical protein
MGHQITQWEWNNFQEIFPAWLAYCWFQSLFIVSGLWSVSLNPSLMYTRGSFLMLLIVLYAITGAEGAFKKLKPEPQSLLGSGGPSPPSAPQHAGHTPTTASCPTPARRRHRTTFTQVHSSHTFLFKHEYIYRMIAWSNCMRERVINILFLIMLR